MPQMEIRAEKMPQRCEVCHQSDLFDAVNNYCSRCATAVNEKLQTEQQLHRQYQHNFALSLMVTLLWCGAITPVTISYFQDATRDLYFNLDGIIISSIMITMVGIFLRYYLNRRIYSLVLLNIAAVIIFLKPFVAPLKYSYLSNVSGEMVQITGAFSLTSETHLYFLIPGALLKFVAFMIYVFDIDTNKKFRMKHGRG